jgi:hypothetical protein
MSVVSICTAVSINVHFRKRQINHLICNIHINDILDQPRNLFSIEWKLMELWAAISRFSLVRLILDRSSSEKADVGD